MKTLFIISFSDLARDPRVNRQIRLLRERYHVVAAGLAGPNVPGVDYIPVTEQAKTIFGKLLSALYLLTGRFERYYWRVGHVQSLIGRTARVRPDIVLANDVESLPVALFLAKGARVVFDAHEYAPLQFEDRLRFRIFWKRYKTYLCNTYIPKANGMITVSAGIADRYRRETGQAPVVITNAPDFENIEPVRRSVDSKIQLVHHGRLSTSRRLGLMLRMMALLDDRFELNLMLVNNDASALEALKREAESLENVRFLPPVPMRELPRALNHFDVGVALFPPVTFNLKHVLPNKFFEFVQARLALAIGPSEEMAAIVRQYDLGIVSDDFSPEAMAEVLSSLTHEKIFHFKQRAHEAARDLSAETNRDRLIEVLRGEDGRRPQPD